MAVTINSRFKAYWSAILSHCPASGVPARTRLAEVRRNECLSSSRTPGLRLLSSRPALSLLLSEASNPCHDADEHLYTSHPAVGIFWGEARYLENIRGARGWVGKRARCGLLYARAYATLHAAKSIAFSFALRPIYEVNKAWLLLSSVIYVVQGYDDPLVTIDHT